MPGLLFDAILWARGIRSPFGRSSIDLDNRPGAAAVDRDKIAVRTHVLIFTQINSMRRTSIFVPLLLPIFCIAPPFCHAAIYYVSVADGNDTSCTGLASTAYVSGSVQACPWKTISKITSTTFAAGDSILFKSDETFAGNLQFANETGASGNPILVGAYGTGQHPVLTANGSGRTIDLRNSASYITFQNLTLRGAATDNIFLYTGTFDHLIFSDLDIASGTALSVNAATTTNSLFQNISVHDASKGFSDCGVNTTFRNITVAGGTVGLGCGLAASATTTGLTIDGFTVTNTSDVGLGIRRLANSSIANVTASSTKIGISIDLGISNVNFSNLVISGSAQYGIQLSALGPVSIANATTTYNSLAAASLTGSGQITATKIYAGNNNAGGIIWTGTAPGRLQLTDSILEHNSGDGLLLSGGGSAMIEHTVARYNLNDGFGVKGAARADFADTVADTNGVDGIGANGDGYSWHDTSTGSLTRSKAINNKKGGVTNVGSASVDVYGNIFVHDTAGTLPMISMWDTTSSHIYNNTFYNASNQGTAIQIGGGTLQATSTIANNIIQGFAAGIASSTSPGYLQEHHNWIFGTATSATTGFPLSNTSTTSDPLLADPQHATYFLTTPSAAIDVGADVGSTADYVGNPRYGAPDIGAYEYQPPYVMGTNAVNLSGNIRIYKDGRYRYTSATSTSNVAPLSVTPVGGSFQTYAATDIRPLWLDISNIMLDSGNSYARQWIASSTDSAPAVFTVGGLTPNNTYTVSVDGVAQQTLTANGSGAIAYTYSGGWSAHTFGVTADSAPVITLAGSTSINLHVGDTYTELGATAADDVDGAVSVTIGGSVDTDTPGIYSVTYDALDSVGNRAAQVIRTVTVSDASGPTFSSVPSDITVEATSTTGTVITYTSPTATDDVDGLTVVSCTPVSGSTFAIGTASVTCSSEDSSHNTSYASFSVTVHLAAAPVATSGSGGHWSAPHPTAPSGGFSATASADTTGTVLHFNFGKDITRIAIATSTDFASATYVAATSTIEWATSTQSLFVKYCNRYNRCSSPVEVSGSASAPVSDGSRSYQFSRNLALHATGSDVLDLQKYLNAHGFIVAPSGPGSPGSETDYFGLGTYAALLKYQASVALPATGFFGPLTRAQIGTQAN